MVNMVGFHHEEPKYNTAIFGEEGYYVHIRHAPTASHQLRAFVSTPTARAMFDNPRDARNWATHPGSLPHMVAKYLKWASAINSQPNQPHTEAAPNRVASLIPEGKP